MKMLSFPGFQLSTLNEREIEVKDAENCVWTTQHFK